MWSFFLKLSIMKNLVFIFILTIGLASCNKKSIPVEQTEKTMPADAQKAIEKTPTTETLTTIKFNKNNHDFGQINEGDIVKTTFTIKNTGKVDLILTNAKGSCGCTVPQVKLNTPIAPGESTDVVVQFNSTNKPNKQMKRVTFYGNFNSPQHVTIEAEVTPKKQDSHDGHNH